jgi:hypothetical protein
MQDLEGFDHLGIKAVYPTATRRGPGSTGSADSSLTSISGRLPLQEASLLRLSQQQAQHAQQQGLQLRGKAPPSPSGAWSPGAFGGFAGALGIGGAGAGAAARRRPQGATPLSLSGGLASEAGECGSAPTPTLFLGGRGAAAPAQRAQQAEQATPAMGLPEEQWSPIDLDQASHSVNFVKTEI